MEYYISQDKEKLDLEKIHREIKATYWAGYRTMEQTISTVESCTCFGLYDRTDKQIGYARLLTDHVAFAQLMDVIIFDPHKGKGLGKFLVKHIMDQKEVREIKTIALRTKDAHGLYEPFGFERVGGSDTWMALNRIKYRGA